ncbi:spore germination protein GerPB [Cytobacillus suaedae]|nr:spore germination protein GerPB [Cytobacillus suaedae]
MNFYINQSICINYLRVGSVANSSVLQIGSAGIIKPLSNLYNTGGYTQPAPEIATDQTVVTEDASEFVPAVPLSTVNP